MSKLKLTGKEIRSIGYPEGPVVSVAMQVMEKNYKHHKKEEIMELLKKILASPMEYRHDAVHALIAELLLPKPNREEVSTVSLRNEGVPFTVFGREHIEEGAFLQMRQAARLPIAVSGALMPDAHAGYGLPIGGVLATDNAIIPYGVGVDIGCRMCLSIYDIEPGELKNREAFYTRELQEATLFGSGRQFDELTPHAVLERKEFSEISLLRNLQARAARQLGSSGSGNHFVEFGQIDILETDAIPGVPAGRYLGLLSHSGSRALGAQVADHYTQVAKSKRALPAEASNLAWLGMEEEEGMEYWLAMNLAGDYASACHEVIHAKISRQLGRTPIGRVENHHNFAWKEILEGRELIVHRKGATPAGRGVLGIIPGSMTAPGFIVRGKGELASLDSASHGAGRRMSRSRAMASITEKEWREELQKKGVHLLGGGLDEAPFAYKDIEMVMKSQKSLVEVLGTFTPKIVKMDGTVSHSRKRKRNQAVEGE